MAITQVRKGRELRYYFTLVARWLWFILLCALLGGGGAFLASYLQRPVYRATTLLIVDQRSSGQDPYTSLLASDQLVTTYVNLITQPAVLAKAASRVEGTSATALATQVQASAQNQIIQVQVDDVNPVRAAHLANAVGTAFIEVLQQTALSQYNEAANQIAQEINQVSAQIDTLTQQLTALRANNPNDPNIRSLQQQLDAAIAHRSSLQTVSNQLTLQNVAVSTTVRVFQPALTPVDPDHPRPLFNGLLGAVFGLVLALTIVLVRDFLDDRIRAADQVEHALGLATIGSVTRQPKDRTLLMDQRESRLAEYYRIIRTNLGFVSLNKPLHSIVVASPSPHEGKTTTAINLAISLARGGKRVLLVDADLRRPSIHVRLGMQNIGGLTLTLLDEKHNEMYGIATPVTDLYVLTAGPKPPNPTELLESERMRQFLHDVLHTNKPGEQIDVMIIDTPPVLGFADAAVLASYADGVLLVANARSSREGTLLAAKEALKKVNAHVIGVVLNDVASSKQDKYYKGYTSGESQPLRPPVVRSSPVPAGNSSPVVRQRNMDQVDTVAMPSFTKEGDLPKVGDKEMTMILPRIVLQNSQEEEKT